MSANLTTPAGLAAGIMLGGMTMLSPGVALSQSANPSNITGQWSAILNEGNSSLNITQSANGTISGTVNGFPLQGFYNSSSRRIVFLVTVNGVPLQFYSGWLSTNGLAIGGQLSIWEFSRGNPATQGVDYNFSATKVSDFPN
ncbi:MULTISPECIES: hypothetical protein [unclassified Nostoc]|uniref:hypothetical protein n=1 Tax=unclassified Nostoc TaxID=2593658 RepID=UPI0025AB4A0B|nr:MULTISPECIES: hypothetical protein [unclassified Nostoc]MDM9581392.1 hypothetical protein [Nostoc sp. GT001]MDZ7949006.1 hypothetical protein [Nostoc sp. EfeVER01]MDZ7992517.1 hypothetical protein [Nostoc sp. EspVER01]